MKKIPVCCYFAEKNVFDKIQTPRTLKGSGASLVYKFHIVNKNLETDDVYVGTKLENNMAS